MLKQQGSVSPKPSVYPRGSEGEGQYSIRHFSSISTPHSWLGPYFQAQTGELVIRVSLYLGRDEALSGMMPIIGFSLTC